MAKKKKSHTKAEPRQNSVPPARKNWQPVVLILALLVAGFFGVWFYKWRSTAIQPGSFRDFNVLLITLDTTRADHLPVYGYKDVEAHHLEKLGEGSYVFENAISHVPLTLPSHASLLTGMLPIAHGIRDNAGFFLDQKQVTLAEILKNHGYATSAFVSAFVLDSRWQLDQGFDLYYDNFYIQETGHLNTAEVQRPAAETELEFEHWIQQNKDKKFFSWVHFYDPHDPYNPPEPYKTKYQDRLYDGEIAYMDEIIGKLLGKMEELQLREQTMIVVAGDHGESLGEHQEITHAMFVYNTTQHIPLFFYLPGTSGKRVKGIVQHADVTPTILQLLGIESPSEMQGISLLSVMNGSKQQERKVYSESLYAELHYGWSPLKSITTEQYKYIDAPRPELYDLVQDPRETRNILSENPQYGKVLKKELEELISTHTKQTSSGPQKMDPETEERLRALGYIGSTGIATEESRKTDPKDKRHLASALQLARWEMEKKNYSETLKQTDRILKEDPNMIEAHFIASTGHMGLNDYDRAIDELLKTLALRPDHTMALFNLGVAYESKGEIQEAERWYLKVLDHESKHLYASLKLAHLYRRQNSFEKARPYFLQAMEKYQEFLANTQSDQAKSALYETVGEIYFGAGEVLQAEEYFKKAIALTPDRSTLHFNLALIYETKGDWASAMEAYRQETQIDPDSFKAFNNLGLLYRRFNQPANAAVCFERVVQMQPEDPRGYLLLASAYKQLGRENEAGALLQKSRSLQETAQ